MTITPETIAELREIARGASQTPWRWKYGAFSFSELVSDRGDSILYYTTSDDGIRAHLEHDRDLIVAAVNNLVPLCDALEASLAEAAALRARLEKAEGLLRPFADEAAGADHFGLCGSQSWPVAVERLWAARAFLQKEGE